MDNMCYFTHSSLVDPVSLRVQKVLSSLHVLLHPKTKTKLQLQVVFSHYYVVRY